jgi:uncharacterized protein YprB with RNaseH-like and TPR domain
MRARLRTLFQNRKDWPEAVAHLIWMEEHTCHKHNIAYIHHQNCFDREQPSKAIPERIGYLDIEASNLKADFGICLCWVIKPSDSKKLIEQCITPKELRTVLDKNVVQGCIDACLKFDRIVGHYSSRFDIPFLRARALKLGLDFPNYKSLWQTDTWRIARERLAISNNRLGTVAAQCNIKQEKTRITPEHWLGALTGGQNHLDYILAHCRIDVLVLEAVWNKLEKYANKAKTSI